MNKTERDPTGRAASDPGAKLDDGKLMAGLLLQFPRALEAMAEVATFGARKYSVGGWLQVPDAERRYQDAEWRHKLARARGERESWDCEGEGCKVRVEWPANKCLTKGRKHETLRQCKPSSQA